MPGSRDARIFDILSRMIVPLSFSRMIEAAAVNMSIISDSASSPGTIPSKVLAGFVPAVSPTVVMSSATGTFAPVASAA